jgi:RNA polymerase sigma-70 factor (ECF subfamily)
VASAWDWDAVRTHCYREALHLARTHAEADDIAQEAVMRAWRSRHTCRTPSAPWAWIRQITRNEGRRMLSRRSMTHELPTDEVPEQRTQHDDDDAIVMRMDVQRALGGLAPVDRLLIDLRYQDDLTNARVASTLGLSVSNVKVRLHRLRTKLEESLPAP